MSTFPVLTSQRIILRDFHAADADAFFAIFSDDRVTEFYDCNTFSNVEQAQELVTANIGRNAAQDGTGLRWVICLTDSPESAIGSCGIHSINKNFHSLEIGYDLHPKYWGNGYAFEAVSKMLSFCFSSHSPIHVNRVTATTDLESHKSIALLKRLGFSEEGILRQYGFWKNRFNDVRLFSLLREEWESIENPPKPTVEG